MKPLKIFEWSYFKFMQIGYPRWPPGVITKNRINMKMMISQEPLVEIYPTLCQKHEAVLIFLQSGIPDGCHLPLLK